MATALNTLVTADSAGVTAKIDYQTQEYHVLTLIKRLLPYLPLWEDVQLKHIADHQGGFGADLIKFRKFDSLMNAANDTALTYENISTTALTEGTNPDGLNVNVTQVTTQLAQYGDWMKITDIAATAGIDDVIKENMTLLAENAGQKLHKVTFAALASGVTQTYYGGSATATNEITAADVMTSTLIKKAVRQLRANNVPTFPDGFYRGILHPYQAYDLSSDSLWQDVAKYNGGAVSGSFDLIAGEIGKIHGVRFRESTTVPVAADGYSSANVYSAYVYGPDFMGAFDLKSQAVANIDTRTNLGISIHYVPVNTPTKDDPLGLYGILGWKASYCAKVIDPKRLVRLNTGATQ